jgi:hypothetical protein
MDFALMVFFTTTSQRNPGVMPKQVPTNIEQHFFKQTLITGYRLKKVA